MTRKVNTVNRGRASHYVNGAQPLKMGFSRDLARLKFNRTYVCKPDELKRLKDELAAEKAKAKAVDNTELTNERNEVFNGTFTATTGASTEAQAGTRDSLAKQLKDKTQDLIDNETELTNERNAAFEGNVGTTGRESLAKQLDDANNLIDTLMAIPKSVNSGNRLLTTEEPYTVPLIANKKIQFISGQQAVGGFDTDKTYNSISHNTEDIQNNQTVAMMNLNSETQRAVLFDFNQTTGQITNLRSRFLQGQTAISNPTSDQLTGKKNALQNGNLAGGYSNGSGQGAWGLKNVEYKYID